MSGPVVDATYLGVSFQRHADPRYATPVRYDQAD